MKFEHFSNTEITKACRIKKNKKIEEEYEIELVATVWKYDHELPL